MNAKELRIGNYIDCDGKFMKVTSITEKKQFCPSHVGVRNKKGILIHFVLEFAKPIPITYDWIIRFGFVRQDNNWKTLDLIFATVSWERLAGFTLSFENESIYLPHIKYVHQLQNLYFSLTGEELTTLK